jgi:hypothetical protein
VEYSNAWSDKYTGGGARSLTDGIIASLRSGDGFWQGFEGQDLTVTLDFSSERNFKMVRAGFLQNQSIWIFLPKKVTIETSTDGINYITADSVITQGENASTDVVRRDYNLQLNTKARYLRFNAENVGICPIWHKGSGGKAWLFIDELVVY